MKKFVSLLMTVVLLATTLTVFAVPALADDAPKSETFENVASTTVETKHFRLTSSNADPDGWYAGLWYPFTIEALVSGITITRIDCTVSWNGQNYGGIVFDHGTKEPDCAVETGVPVSVTNIDAASVSVIDGDMVEFRDITVYYEETDSENSSIASETVEAVPDEKGTISIHRSGNYIISVDREIFNLHVGIPTSDPKNLVLTIAPNVTVTAAGNFDNYGTVNVNGTLIWKGNEDNQGTICVGCGGTLEGGFGNGNAPIYEEHSFNDSGVCEKCGILKSCFEGEHEYDDNGLCEYCGAVSVFHEHDFTTGQCVCGMLCPHDEWNEASCAACGYECPHEAERDNGFCTLCGCLVDEASHTHDFTDGDCLCGAPAPEAETASVLSEGSLWIVCAVGAAAVIAVAALVIAKKKKTALASGTDNTDEE